MHLYQAGMPLALLTEWLGHADPETTLIYARARRPRDEAPCSRESQQRNNPQPLPTPLWHDREDIIQRLCGLKE
jgi:hypothetical protein